MKKLVLIISALMAMASGAMAKDMTRRLGVGPRLPFSIELPAMGLTYFPNTDYAITGALGIKTDTGYSQFGLQGGIRRIIFEEHNMNFHVGGALGVISNEVAGVNQSGFELLALAGGEFFMQGLENLGFNFDVGVGVASLKNSNRFFTVANTPLRAGVTFYF